MSCASITIGSAVDCDDIPEGGTNARLILINYDDVTEIYEDSEGNIVSIGLKSGKTGFEFLGFRNDMKKSEEVVNSTTSYSRFKHNVGFIIYEVSQVQKNNVTSLAKGRFIAIVENKGKNENSIEVMGRECGVKAIDGQIRSAFETNGVFVLNLSSPGEELEKRLPQNLGSSYNDGLELIETILGSVVGEGFDYEFDFEVA